MCLAMGQRSYGAPAQPLEASAHRSEIERALQKVDPANLHPIHITLLADKKDHRENEHDYPVWQDRWALLLGGDKASSAKQVNLFGAPLPGEGGAMNVTVSRALGWPSDDQFRSSQVIVAFCYLTWNDARKRQMKSFLEGGGGLVVIHSATWTKPGPDGEVAGMVGVGGFSKFRHGPLRLDIVGDHPICRGLPTQIPLLDEPYWPPVPPIDPSRTLALAVSHEQGTDGTVSPQPMVWLTRTGEGRVFGCVPGHYTWTFDDPWFRLLLLRGIAWAAGQPPERFDALALVGARLNQ